MVVKKIYWHGHVSFFCQKIPGKKICSTAARRSQKMLFAFSKKPFFRFAIFVPAVASGRLWLSPAGYLFRKFLFACIETTAGLSAVLYFIPAGR